MSRSECIVGILNFWSQKIVGKYFPLFLKKCPNPEVRKRMERVEGKSPGEDWDLDYLKSLVEKDTEWDPAYLDCLTDADKKAVLEAWAEDARPDSPSTIATRNSEETGETGKF